MMNVNFQNNNRKGWVASTTSYGTCTEHCGEVPLLTLCVRENPALVFKAPGKKSDVEIAMSWHALAARVLATMCNLTPELVCPVSLAICTMLHLWNQSGDVPNHAYMPLKCRGFRVRMHNNDSVMCIQ